MQRKFYAVNVKMKQTGDKIHLIDLNLIIETHKFHEKKNQLIFANFTKDL